MKDWYSETEINQCLDFAPVEASREIQKGPVSRETAKNDQPFTKADYPLTIMALIRPGCTSAIGLTNFNFL